MVIELSKELKNTYQVIHQDPKLLEVQLVPSENWSYFAGHFPSFPVLPAVAIIDISSFFAKILSSKPDEKHSTALAQVKNFRIRNPIAPAEKLQVTVTHETVTCEASTFHVIWKSSEQLEKVFAELKLEFSSAS